MQNQNQNQNDNTTLLLLLGAGALYYLTKDKDKTADDTNSTAPTTAPVQQSPQVVVVPQPTAGQTNSMTQEDLQRYMRQFQQDMSLSLQEQFRQFTLEQQAQEEQDNEAQVLAEVYGDEQVKSLDLRDKAKDVIGKFCINYYRQIMQPARINDLKNLQASYYDIYNFADADTLLRANTFTQRNNIDVCRFRINELTVFNIERAKIDDLNVFHTDYYIDAVNPTDSDVQYSAYPYKMTIDDFIFVPYFDYEYINKYLRNMSRAQKFVYEIWQGYSQNPFNAENVTNYLTKIVAKIISYYPVPDYKTLLQNVADVYMQSEEHYKKYRYIDISPKSMSIVRQDAYWVCKDSNDFLKAMANYQASKRDITIYYYLFDEQNRIARNIELKGSLVKRPALGERDTAYITDFRTKNF